MYRTLSCTRIILPKCKVTNVCFSTLPTRSCSTGSANQRHAVSINDKQYRHQYSNNGGEKCRRFPLLYPGTLFAGSVIITFGDENLSSNSRSDAESFNFNSDQHHLLLAARDNDIKELRRLIREKADVNKKHPYGWTALSVAAMNNNTLAVKILLDSGAHPNLPDSYSTAMEVANEQRIHNYSLIRRTRDEEFSKQLSHLNNFRGSTALHYAALADNKEILEVLLEAGADPSIKNADGYKAVDYATQTHKAMLNRAEKGYEQKQAQIKKEQRQKYPLERRFSDKIIGQKGAIKVVSSAIRRKENGWFDENHPLVMLFLGSSGIGKTELAKQLAAYLHGDSKHSFIRFDMSEFQTKHEAAKFIGAPPGYVGHEDGGQLTSQLTKCPNAVVLFDEVDKAHPDVLATLLQLFDEGRLTDSKGHSVECKEAVFIMTANLANEEICEHALDVRTHRSNDLSVQADHDEANLQLSREFKDEIIHPILKKHFKRDEFLGRINEIVFFLPFTETELKLIILKQLQYWAKRADDVHKMELTWSEDVLESLSSGYDVHYGARSLIYEVERKVVGKLAAAQEKGLIQPCDKVKLTIDSNKDVVLNKLESSGNLKPIPNNAYRFVSLN